MGIERRRWAAYHEPWLRFRIAVIAFPAEIIQHAIWLYLRFTLSYRDVEELVAERGLDVWGTFSGEAIRGPF